MFETMAATASADAAVAVNLFLSGDDDGLAQANELAAGRELALVDTRLSVHQFSASLTSDGCCGLTFRHLTLSSL